MTTAEVGYPDIQGASWVGVLLLPERPNEIIGVLHREIMSILALPEVKERLPALGFEIVASTPGEFATRTKAEIESSIRYSGGQHQAELKPLLPA